MSNLPERPRDPSNSRVTAERAGALVLFGATGDLAFKETSR